MNISKNEVLKKINFSKMNYEFKRPPLLVGGMAMMYYGLRNSDKDIDLVVSKKDHKNLSKLFIEKATILPGDSESGYKKNPQFVDLYGDHGILVYEFEIWDNIMLYGYDDLKEDAKKENEILVISLEKLLFLCAIRGVHKKRYLDDALLIANYFSNEKYKNYKHVPNSYWKEIKSLKG